MAQGILTDGGPFTFLDALPVFPEEAEFRHGNRADELLNMWEEWEVKPWDPAPGPPARVDRHNGFSDEISGLHPGPKQLQKIRSYVN
jgi:hypothetical protein